MQDKEICAHVIAPGFCVSQTELDIGVGFLNESGFKTIVDPQCKSRYLYYAGRPGERGRAFLRAARSPMSSIVWCARGGYGSGQILESLPLKSPGKRKLLIGYSDITAMYSFVMNRWGWSVLHGVHAGFRKLPVLDPLEWEITARLVRGDLPKPGEFKFRLCWVSKRISGPLSGKLFGGNLSTLVNLVGSPFQPKTWGDILFLEDVDENFYFMDRMLDQLERAGVFKSIKAIVLGDFLAVTDRVGQGLRSMPRGTASQKKKTLLKPTPKQLKPLRPEIGFETWMNEKFRSIALRNGVSVLSGLPVGHGPHFYPLPIGAKYEIRSNGDFALLDWDWKN